MLRNFIRQETYFKGQRMGRNMMSNKEENGREYVLKTAELLDLTIDPQYLPKVVENWLAITKIASLVTEFELIEEIESAASFQPELRDKR